RHMTDALLDAQLASKQAHILSEIKDQVLYSLSHELRTPLTQVLGYLELLEGYREHLDAETQAHYLAGARSGCEELMDLLSTALETRNASRAERPLHLQTVILHQEVQTVLAQFAPQVLANHPVTLAFSESLQVFAEPRFVRQILRNLLTNAFKYTPASLPILVKAHPLEASSRHSSKQEDALCIQVIDAGPGISPIYQSLLFQPFVRLPNTSTPTISGTGLGLAICKQLVEAMGGQIWVESSGRAGEGCRFSFTLTRGREPELAASSETKE
ncbi:MAG TPA: HAMP domain-containing sensor histidine kinase, partial [Ktedonobacteraceae bacterium]|nr:HAMP domain-containing sensor histidine kinase [Ktedonobacteraceae bacterium]